MQKIKIKGEHIFGDSVDSEMQQHVSLGSEPRIYKIIMSNRYIDKTACNRLYT